MGVSELGGKRNALRFTSQMLLTDGSLGSGGSELGSGLSDAYAAVKQRLAAAQARLCSRGRLCQAKLSEGRGVFVRWVVTNESI